MTWLSGSTTWGALPQKLAQLLCGEVADDNAATVASGDRWVREFTRTVTDGVLNSTTTVTSATAAFTAADKGANVIGTGIPAGTTIATVTNGTTIVLSAAATATGSGVTLQIAHDTIRTASSADASTGAISNRCGYFGHMYHPGDVTTAATSRNTFCKVTSPFTSDPSTSGFHRWVVTVTVNTANSVSGNYSTASLNERIWDADSGVSVSNATRNPNSAGLVTGANGLTYTVGDASGTLLVSTVWQRGFSATYMYGIDLWKMLHRQGSTAPSFSVAPPGVAGTDYDIVRLPMPSSLTASSGITNATQFDTNVGAVYYTGNLFHGLGIKTATGLGSNPLYTVSFSMALFKGRIFYSGTNGILSLDVGQSMVDAVNSAGGGYRLIGLIGSSRVASWIKCAATAGSVSSSTGIQYFISVKANGVIVVLNADPSATGKLGVAAICAFTPAESTYDVLPIAYTRTVYDYTADQSQTPLDALASQHMYLWLRRHQDGSEGSRDWQTKWMRADLDNAFVPMVGNPIRYQEAAGVVPTTNSASSGVPYRQNQPAQDGKWWLYGYQFGEGTTAATWSTNATDEAKVLRGYWNSRFFFVPGGSWSSGDELSDTVSGQKYLLVMPDYLGVGYRWRATSNTYQGGLAIAEV